MVSALDFHRPVLDTSRLGRSKIARDLFCDGKLALAEWKPHFKSDRSASFQVIDFFSGCGGMSLGFASLGRSAGLFEVVGGCDLDPDSAKSFESNFGVPCVTADVAYVARSPRAIHALLKKYPKFDPGRETILIGCAPCQGFTSHRKKNWNTPDVRNSLPGNFASIAAELQPSCVVIENVPELLSNKYRDQFAAVVEILQSAGYTVKQSIYNAAEFGAPQERFRAVILAMKRNFLLPKPFFAGDDLQTVRDAIGQLPPVEAGDRRYEATLHFSAKHKQSTLDTIKAVPRDGGSRPPGVGPSCLDKIKGFSDVYGRLYWDRPAITITHYARNPASGRFVHPDQNRGLTIRECARLQTFPDSFEFHGSSDAIYRQIGEAVPPVLALGIASHVMVEILLPEPTNHELTESMASIDLPVSDSYSSVIAGIKNSRRKR